MVQAAQENAQKSQNLLYHISLNSANNLVGLDLIDPLMIILKLTIITNPRNFLAAKLSWLHLKCISSTNKSFYK